jgi:hypothetical protein
VEPNDEAARAACGRLAAPYAEGRTVKPVARAGDVQALASSATNYPNDASPTATGTWAPLGPVTETTVQVAGSDGRRVVRSASCQFGFTGTNTQSGAAFTSPPSTVTLNPASRKLKVGGGDPLVDGDEARDAFGNQLRVSSSASWRTV